MYVIYFSFFSVKTGTGLHWFVICRPTENCLEIFDSLGTSEQYILNLPISYSGHCEYNTTAVQPSNSANCGEYCLFFVCMRYFNLDLDFFEFLNDIFVENKEDNEQEVISFIRTL